MEKLYRKYLNLNIRNKIFYSNIIMILLMVILMGGAVYYFSSHLLVNAFEQSSRKLMEQLGANLNSRVRNTGDFAVAQQMNSELLDCLNYDDRKDSAKDRYNRNKYIEKYAYNLISYNDDIKAVIVKDVYGETYFNSADERLRLEKNKVAEMIPYDEAIASRGKLLWKRYDNQDESIIFASRVIYDKYSMQAVGVLSLVLDRGFFEEVCRSITEDKINNIVILNKEGQVLIASTQESEIFARAVVDKEGVESESGKEIYFRFKKYFYSLQEAESNNIYLMDIVNMENLTSDAKKILMPFLYASAIALVLAFIFSEVFSRTMSRTMKELLKGIKKFAKGDFSQKIEPKTKDEIGELAMEFNHMSDEMQRLLEDISEEKVKNKTAEIKVLQSEYDSLQAKINPHFLYNTLESINSMAKIHGETEIADAVQQLGNYLRETVSRENLYVCLSKELDNVISFMKIQEIIHGGRLQYKIDADGILMEAMVPKLILQPLIENAIVHGIEPKPGGGIINIHIFCRREDIVIEIKDNGVGIESSRLNGGMLVQEEHGCGHAHVGILSVHKRIQILYGGNYGIQIESKPWIETCISVTLPIRFEGEWDDNETV